MQLNVWQNFIEKNMQQYWCNSLGYSNKPVEIWMKIRLISRHFDIFFNKFTGVNPPKSVTIVKTRPINGNKSIWIRLQARLQKRLIKLVMWFILVFFERINRWMHCINGKIWTFNGKKLIYMQCIDVLARKCLETWTWFSGRFGVHEIQRWWHARPSSWNR